MSSTGLCFFKCDYDEKNVSRFRIMLKNVFVDRIELIILFLKKIGKIDQNLYYTKLLTYFK